MNKVAFTPRLYSPNSALAEYRERIKLRVQYPESDGEPVAESTVQFRWIMTIHGNLEILFSEDSRVFVAGDLLWYPVEGSNTIRMAPDVMVAFGAFKGDRGAYMQWREGGIAPQVVFEILSPGNRKAEMENKFAFYERYGVEEYYVYDPGRGLLNGWLRNRQGKLVAIPEMNDWISPRMSIRFALEQKELVLFYPDGTRFPNVIELGKQRAEAQQEASEARLQLDEAETKAEQAQLQAEQEARRAEQAEAKLRELEEKLRAAGLS